MSKHTETYYLLDEKSNTIFWTEKRKILENSPDLIFLGSSINPNRKMAVAAFMKRYSKTYGFKIKELL